jgi:ubiquitin-like domain-containing CTD phosphatase 1
LHTADRDRDVLDPAEDLCPRLYELAQEAEESDEFQKFNTSQESVVLRHLMQSEGLGNLENEAIDCLMTTMCTDRVLPDILNDYGGRRRLHHIDYGSNIFERIYNFSIMEDVFSFRYNDAAYSKLAMGPMWAEIMDNIKPIVDTNTYNYDDRPPPHTKLALFSGHDTTIMPLLATLGPNVWDGTTWTPYASMMILEIHELIDGQSDKSVFTSDYAFRLLYNGEVLTDKMDGCPADSDLCDVKVLLDRVSPFATRQRDCALQGKYPSDTLSAVEHAESLFVTTQGLLIVVAVVCMSAVMGSVVTYMILTGRVPHWCDRKRRAARELIAKAEQAGLQLSVEESYHDSPHTNGKAPIAALTEKVEM